MTGTKPAHFVVVPHAMWGHVRPFLHLCLNILSTHPSLHISLLVAPSVSARVTRELASSSFAHIHTPPKSSTPIGGEDAASAQPKALIERLQVIDVATPEFKEKHKTFSVQTMADEAMEYAKLIPGILSSLFAGEGSVGIAENKFESMKPTLLMFDTFQAFIPEVARQLAKSSNGPIMKLIGFCPSNAAACFHHVATPKDGGFLEIMLDHVQKGLDNGMTPEEAWSEYLFYTDGRVVRIPGVPTMYDYEFFPQIGATPVPPQAGMQVTAMIQACRDQDVIAMIVPTVEELEPETNKAMEKMSGKPFLQAGLQFPQSSWDGIASTRDVQDGDAKRVLTFLDEMLEKRGERSVAYVSFGSLFFPAGRPELAQWLAESLTESDIPFVFAYATDMYPVSEDLLSYINNSPLSVAVRFAPQWQVLEHPATRFFVSHCGSNSTAEAILAGMPLVSFPFAADQGEFTAMLTNLGVAIDLKQVKTFRNKAWTKLYDGTEIIGTEEAIKEEQKSVWKTMMGPTADEMREKMQKVRAIADQSRKEGKAKEVMEGLAKWF